ncbi:MAG: SulP family inorganic anion transporter [Anaerolineae bacterium]
MRRPSGRWAMYGTPQDTLGYALQLLGRPVAVLRGIRREHLRPDAMAAVTVTLIVLPQAMAYALLADLPPQAGLYAAILASIVAALWGSSNHLQTGPTNTSSLLTLSALATIATPGTPEHLAAAGLLAVMAGVLRVVMGLANLGLLVRFVSDAVIVGFTAGAGVLIAANQLRNLLRLNVPATAELLETAQVMMPKLGEAHLPSLALGVGAMALILLLRRLNRHLPGPFIALVVAAAAVGVSGLDVKVIGRLPAALPPFTPLPITDLGLIGRLSTSALSIGAIGLVEALSIARVLAAQTGQRLDSNQEFIGQGMANIACGFFAGYPVSGSFVRSTVNLQAGAVSPLSNILTGLLVLMATLALGPVAAYIPLPALAGVLILSAYSLIDRHEMARIWRGGGTDRLTMIVTLIATLMLPLHFAVMAGILMSLGGYLLQTSTPRVVPVLPAGGFRHFEHQPDQQPCPQLGIVEIQGDLYFGAAQHVEAEMHRHMTGHPGQRFLLLRMQGVHHCDISGIHALETIVRAYREQHGDVFLTRVRPQVLTEMRVSGFWSLLGHDRLLPEDSAISHLFHHVLDPAVCIYECPVRAFLECQNLPKQLYPHLGVPHTVPPKTPLPAIEPLALWQALHGSSPPQVIDVREPREYRQGRVPGSRLIPLPALLNDPGQVARAGPVVLVCRSRRRSARAAAALLAAGRSNVAVLREGMLAWEAANLLEASG